MVERFCGNNYFVYLAMPQDVLTRWAYMTARLDAKERELGKRPGPAPGEHTHSFTMADED